MRESAEFAGRRQSTKLGSLSCSAILWLSRAAMEGGRDLGLAAGDHIVTFPSSVFAESSGLRWRSFRLKYAFTIVCKCDYAKRRIAGVRVGMAKG